MAEPNVNTTQPVPVVCKEWTVKIPKIPETGPRRFQADE